MSITVKEVDKTYFPLYDQVSMNVDVKSEYRVNRVNGGLGGFVFEEAQVTPFVKDLSKYERAVDYEKMFDISTWRFFMAFDGEKPVGGMTVAGPTQGMDMMGGRNDACVLWDIRVEDGYKHMGIGQKMLDQGIAAAKARGNKIKLIARAAKTENGIEYSVGPMELPESHPLAGVNDEFNAIFVKGNAVDDLMFYGKGAGPLPTGSAVMVDVLTIAQHITA